MKAAFFIFVVYFALVSPAFSQEQPTSAPSPGLNGAATDQNGDGQPDARWPMNATTVDGQITVFEPQVESLTGNQLTARAAVSVQRANEAEPIFGALWLSSRVSTDRVARTVDILDVKITKTHFPDDDQNIDAHALETALTQAISSQPMQLALDGLLAMLQDVQQENASQADLKTDAPKIVFRDRPAVLVQYDGVPKPAEGADANAPQRIANTPFFVAQDSASKQYFLKGAGQWFEAPDPMGPFALAKEVPAAISDLAAKEDYKDPTTTQPSMTPQQQTSVEIITATEPTELIWTDGKPQMTPIENTKLLYVANTEADWFVDIDTQQNYVLLSGRWYASHEHGGEFAYVPSDKLPADFAKIPPNSDKADVLAQVAGTPQADDAVADTYVPQTATVNRKTFDQPTVEYDGDPQFQPADGTSATYAVNTSVPVLFVDGNYYACSNAVWYVGKSARGPWALCDTVPGEIYKVSPSCPVYGVRYCQVYGATDDVVYVGYTPGYVGCYPFNRTVVYGTGYRYRPWWGHRYYARPATYGYAARYNSYVGHWGFDFGLATGSGGSWIGQGPAAPGRHDSWFGYGGYRPVVLHREVQTELFRNQYLERVRASRGQAAVAAQAAREEQREVQRDRFARNIYERRNDVRWDAKRPRDSKNERPGANAPQHPTGSNVPVVSPKPQTAIRADAYVDKSGNVYRRNEAGGWELRQRGQWQAQPAAAGSKAAAEGPKPVQQPGGMQTKGAGQPANANPKAPAPAANPNADLDRAYRARAAGNARLNGYQRPNAPAARPAPPAPAPKPAPAPRPAPPKAPPPPPRGK